MKKLIVLLLVVSLFFLHSVLAAPPMPSPPSGWYYGDLHVHTGYSSEWGYDNNKLTEGDNCNKESFKPFHRNEKGYSISQLKTEAKSDDFRLDTIKYWFSITDHSYCLNTTEK